MSKRFAFVAAFLLLVVACGGDKDEADLNSALASVSPGATQATGGATAAPGAGATAAPAKTAAPAAQGATSSQPRPASQGGLDLPKDGSYVYNLEGTSTDPTNPTAPPRAYKGTLTRQYSHSGNVVTEEQTTDQSPGRTTQRYRFEATRVVLLSVRVESPQGDFSCDFDPPLLVAHVPVRPEKIPTQQFKGSGNACNGTLDVEILRKEDAKDANGRSWSTWRIHVKTSTKSGQFSLTADNTLWRSPDIGVDIRSDGTSSGQIGSGPTGAKFKGTAKAALKSYPR
jgi:hypothetical protein